MNKFPIFALLILLNLALIPALSIEVQETAIDDLVIKEFNSSATFDIEITNLESTNEFQIFSYVGVQIEPREFTVPPGETETLTFTATPSEKVKSENQGSFIFEYRIAGKEPGTYRDSLRVRILSVADILDIQPVEIFPEQSTALLKIKNTESKPLDLTLNLNSDFFQDSHELSILGKEETEIQVPINKEIQDLEAGEYTLETTLIIQNQEAEKESIINYLEQGGLSTQESSEGFIIRKTSIVKENTGNIPSLAIIEARRNVITRLFTSFSEVPIQTDRNGFFVDYTWERALAPNESINLRITTNYTVPFILLILVIVIAYLVWRNSRTSLSIDKRVHFVKTKGGQFALRIRLKIRARKSLESVEVTDRIPGIAKVHEKFGTKPDKFDEKSRRISWNLDSMNAGEERTFSYLIYSKIKVVGSLELPLATASYKLNGKTQFAKSNKTTFAAEGS